VSGAVQERLRETLRAVATDDEAREALAAGRLVRDYTPSGLASLLGSQATPSPRDGVRNRQLEERLEQARAKQRELDEKVAAARRELRDARREATRAAAALERAEAAQEQAEARAREAGERTAELEARLAE
jgi:hypothetical protein